MGYRSFRTHRLHLEGSEGVLERLKTLFFKIDVAEVVTHEGYEPGVIFHFLEAQGLAGQDVREVDLLAVKANSAARGDQDRSVVEWIFERGKTCIRFL
jgi:hypothetical protein